MRLESGRVFGLDVMRASAIGLVLLSHTTLWFANYPACFDISLVAGYLGVELFFVLSGFLIGGILLHGLIDETSKITLFGFWRRRWLRTLPNYFLFLGVNVGIFFWAFHTPPRVLPYLFFAQNITARPPSFFVESWSLAVEEWFYILLPVLFLLCLRISPKRFRINSLAVICIVIVAVTIVRSIYVFAAHPAWLSGVRMIVPYRLDACMFGVLAAWANHFHPGWWQWRARFLFACGLIMLGLVGFMPFILPADSFFPHTLGFTFTSIGAAMLLPMLQRWTRNAGRNNPIVKLSLWSYSLYLVNLPVFFVIFCYRENLGRLGCVAGFLLFSVMISALIYRFFERPVMNLREGFKWPRFGFPRLNAPVPATADP